MPSRRELSEIDQVPSAPVADTAATPACLYHWLNCVRRWRDGTTARAHRVTRGCKSERGSAMVLPLESCQDCGKVMKGRAIPRVWDGQCVVCSACYRTFAAERSRQEEERELFASKLVAVSVSDSDLLSDIVKLAEGRRLVCLTYQKPG